VPHIPYQLGWPTSNDLVPHTRSVHRMQPRALLRAAAAFQGDVETCRTFLNSGGPDMLKVKNDDGETALHVAVRKFDPS
jgi:ankyrin repeat protein